MAKGSFATGFDQTTRKAYLCPEHGEISTAYVVPTYHGYGFHLGCGKDLEMKRVRNQPITHAGYMEPKR
jgi:hypothetical protein